METLHAYQSLIKENLEYDALLVSHPHDKNQIGLVNIVIGGKEEKRDALRSSAIICFPQRIKERKEVVNCRMK